MSAPIDYSSVARNLRVQAEDASHVLLVDECVAAAKLCEAWPLVHELLLMCQSFNDAEAIYSTDVDDVVELAQRIDSAVKP